MVPNLEGIEVELFDFQFCNFSGSGQVASASSKAQNENCSPWILEMLPMRLSSHFKSERIAKHLKPGDVARAIGYQNIAKGANRIVRFEREGVVKEDLLIKVAAILGIDWTTVEELAEQDRQEHVVAWNKWADEPTKMLVVIKWMAAVYSQRLLPVEITTPEAAEAFACDLARQLNRSVCLVLSRRQSAWINDSGTVFARTEATPFSGPNMPWMQLKSGKKFLLDFDD
jgi:hypothetical protein